MGPQLAIVHGEGNPGHVVVAGEIDICTASYLQDSLSRAVEQCRAVERAGGPGAAVIVDMSAVTFIDGCGLRVLAVADAYACVRGVSMRFTSVPASIARLLRITGLTLPGQSR